MIHVTVKDENGKLHRVPFKGGRSWERQPRSVRGLVVRGILNHRSMPVAIAETEVK